MKRFDVVVVGGGIAGSTSAAALARRGLQVLLVEAGLPSEKRLAGELMHPAACAVLEELDLLEPLLAAGAAEVRGFAVLHDAEVVGSPLEYTEIDGGEGRTSIAIEHGVMVRALLDAVGQREGVTVWEGRVTDVEDLHSELATVHVRRGAEIETVQAPLVVSAEGRSSRIRQRAGIAVQRGAPFRMVGWRVPNTRLPRPGYGHVFAGGATTSLAYRINDQEVRVMFELGIDDDLDVSHLLAALPEPFSEDVRRAIETQPRETAKVWGMSPARVSTGRLAVVGDAGGCVHPLTASGIAFCTQDAARLAAEVGLDFQRGAGVLAALDRYEKGRRGPMRARVALGPAMVEALGSNAPEMKLLRHGLFRYWRKSKQGRARSLALLSTHESRVSVMAREYAAVCAHALTGLPAGVVPSAEVLPALVGLARQNVSRVREVVAGL